MIWPVILNDLMIIAILISMIAKYSIQIERFTQMILASKNETSVCGRSAREAFFAAYHYEKKTHLRITESRGAEICTAIFSIKKFLFRALFRLVIEVIKRSMSSPQLKFSRIAISAYSANSQLGASKQQTAKGGCCSAEHFRKQSDGGSH